MGQDRKFTVVLADDHPLIVEEVTRVLSGHFDIVAKAGDGVSAVQAIAECEPDVAVLDIAMPMMNGFDVAREISRMRLRTKVVFLTCFSDLDYLQMAKAMGAGYVVKSQMRSNLIPAISKTLAARPIVGQEFVNSQ